MTGSVQGRGRETAPADRTAGDSVAPHRDPPGEAGLHLRILATSDLHASLMPYDYYNDRATDRVGLVRTAGLIAAARGEAANVLLFDNGDLLQGSPQGDFYAGLTGSGPEAVHPMIAAMNALGYDAATLGNHDFNYGLETLERSLRGADFPFVLANVRKAGVAGAGPPLLPPWVILTRDLKDARGGRVTLRIGVAGFVPPQIMLWDRDILAGRVEAADAVGSVRTTVAELRRAGADVVIVLNHSGIGHPDAAPDAENTGIAVGRIGGVDAQILGHSHEVFPGAGIVRVAGVDPERGLIGDTPSVLPGSRGSHLGVIDLALARDGQGWRVHASRSEARPIARLGAGGKLLPATTDDAAVRDAAMRPHLATLGYIRRPVGHTEVALHSYFSLLAPDRGLGLVAGAQRAAITRALRAGGLIADLPVLSAVAPLKCGGIGGPENYVDIPPGPVEIRHCADLCPFPNHMRATRITGAVLVEWLERSAAMFLQVTPGTHGQTLLNPGHPCYNFDVIDGVTYRIDLSQPSRHAADGRLAVPGAARIVDLRHAGRPVRPGDMFIVATNSYRLGGSGGFPADIRGDILLQSALSNRDALTRHVAQAGSLRPEPAPIWSFVPMPGTSVIYDTGPRAAAHLGDLAHLRPERIGLTGEGFLRLRLHL